MVLFSHQRSMLAYEFINSRCLLFHFIWVHITSSRALVRLQIWTCCCWNIHLKGSFRWTFLLNGPLRLLFKSQQHLLSMGAIRAALAASCVLSPLCSLRDYPEEEVPVMRKVILMSTTRSFKEYEGLFVRTELTSSLLTIPILVMSMVK